MSGGGLPLAVRDAAQARGTHRAPEAPHEPDVAPRALPVLPDRVQCAPGRIEVIRVDLRDARRAARHVLSALSDEEQARARRYRFEQDRDRFVFTRAMLRAVLARTVAVKPERIAFEAGPAGKPGLAFPSDGPAFNVAHSGELAVIALAASGRVGIDVERIRHMPGAMSLARRFFAASEAAVLAALPGDALDVAFFRCWSCKESFVKALGDGLARPLDSFAVEARPEEPARLVESMPPEDPAGWTLARVDLAPGYAGALAVDDPGPLEIRRWAAPPLAGAPSAP